MTMKKHYKTCGDDYDFVDEDVKVLAKVCWDRAPLALTWSATPQLTR